jgi:YVTN family beta-propeller protein
MTVRYFVAWAVGFTVCAVAVNTQPQSDALLVLNKEDATLAIVDPETGKVRALIPTGDAPHEIAVSTDGKLAFVSNYGAETPGSTISLIDLAAHKEMRRIDLGALRRPHGITFADGKVFFTAEINRLVARYDVASSEIDWLLGTGQAGTHMVLVSRDGSRIFTTNIGSDSVSVMERGATPLAWNQTVISVGKGPEGMDLAPNERELWTAQSRDGGISIVDVASKKVVQTLDVGTKRSNRLKFTPDGRLVLISDLDGGELVVVDVAGRKVAKRLTLGQSPEGILMEPSGARAYVAVNGDNQVAIIDLKALLVTRKIETGRGPDGMAWAAVK